MAIKSTIFKANVQIADIDHGYYADHALTLARHPSETDERMMVRLVAMSLQAHELQDTCNGDGVLAFGAGLSDPDEPDVMLTDFRLPQEDGMNLIQRAKALPKGVDFWDLDCKAGASDATAAPVHFAEIMGAVDALVKEAMGFSKDRGDSINVVNAPFSPREVEVLPEIPLWKQPDVVSTAKEIGQFAGDDWWSQDIQQHFSILQTIDQHTVLHTAAHGLAVLDLALRKKEQVTTESNPRW